MLTTRFVPFLPAHQVKVHRRVPPPSPPTTASLQLQEWSGLKEYSEAVGQRGTDFLFVDIGLQLQAALEAWDILKQWKTYYM